MCDEMFIMYKGRFVETGTKKDIYENPQHIYTKRLLSAIPDVTPNGRDERKIVRIEVERNYQQNHHKYFDDNGRVYDLSPISNTHFVATSSSIKEGI